MTDCKYSFSVIMAVCNGKPYVTEAIESLVAQDIGFAEHIQLILSDAGSTDGTDCICQMYAKVFPENVLYLRSENKDMSEARNRALLHSQGEYVNFMDQDAIFSPEAFGKAASFFRMHKGEVDLAATLVQPQSGCMFSSSSPSRLVDLLDEYEAVQLDLGNVFVPAAIAGTMNLREGLQGMAEMKEALGIQLGRGKLGILGGGYRRLRRKPPVMGNLFSNHGAAFLQYVCSELVVQARKEIGRVPRFLSYGLLRILQEGLIHTAQPDREMDAHSDVCKLLPGILGDISDDIILAQPGIQPWQKFFLLSGKYGEEPMLCPKGEDFSFQVQGREIFLLSECKVCLERLELAHDSLTLEGQVSLPGLGKATDLQIFLQAGDCSPMSCKLKKSGDALFFRGEIRQLSQWECCEVAVCTNFKGIMVEQKHLCGGQDFPLAMEFREAYAACDGWMIRLQGNRLVLERKSSEDVLRQEERLQAEMEHSGKPGAGEGVRYRKLYHSLKPLCRKEIWLIADRIRKADDSGAALFRYLGREERPVEAYFVLRKRQKQDFREMSSYGQVLDFNSHVHVLAGLLADKVISSTTDPCIGNPAWARKRYLRDILWKQKFIYMGQAITKEGWLRSLGHYGQKADLILTSSERECSRILESLPFPHIRMVQLTGLPCHDFLQEAEGRGEGLRQIAIMPTWRKSLAWNRTYYIDGVKRHNPDKLMASKYFHFYQALLDSQELAEGARKYGYVLRFLPHPNVCHYLYCFHQAEGVIFSSLQDRYEDVLRDSCLVVTDYSSVAFNAAYLGKPVIYCQFDREDFCGEIAYEDKKFDYNEEGFGEVCTDLESTIKKMISYMKQGCVTEEVYRLRAEKYFAFHDGQNCERAYRAIMALEQGGPQ